MQGMWNVESFSDSAEYGIMDDIPWEFMKIGYKALLGWQTDITVTDKYRKKVNFKHGKGVIVISNELPMFTLEEYAWLTENMRFCEIKEKVFLEAENV